MAESTNSAFKIFTPIFNHVRFPLSSPHQITNLRCPDRFDEVSASGVRRSSGDSRSVAAKQRLPVNNCGPAATDVEPNDKTENGES